MESNNPPPFSPFLTCCDDILHPVLDDLDRCDLHAVCFPHPRLLGLAQSYLYAKIRLDDREKIARFGGRQAARTVFLLRTVVSRPDLALYIRSLDYERFGGWIDEGPLEVKLDFVQSRWRHMPWYSEWIQKEPDWLTDAHLALLLTLLPRLEHLSRRKDIATSQDRYSPPCP